MAKEFDYSTLTYDDRKEIHGALAETTIKHIDRSGGLFSSIDFDPAASPSQMLEVTHLTPVPTKFEEVHGLADVASPTLSPYVRETLQKHRAFMSAARLLLADGVHIFPVTNHGNIADVAEWSAGWAENLDYEHWQDQNALIISRGVTTIQAFGMAASEVVEKIGHVFLSFPRTETINNLNIDSHLIDTNNKKMRAEVADWLGEKLLHRIRGNVLGKTLHMAWSGKTDKVQLDENNKPKAMELGKVSEGTLDIVQHGLVLPIAVWDSDTPVLELGELTKIKNAADVRQVQEWQRQTLAKALGLNDESVTIEI